MKKYMRALPLVLLTACSHMTVTNREDARLDQQAKEFTMHSFLLGFVPGIGPTSAQEFCPGGKIEALDLRMSGLDVTLALLTVGLYVPHRAKVQCSSLHERQATAAARR